VIQLNTLMGTILTLTFTLSACGTVAQEANSAQDTQEPSSSSTARPPAILSHYTPQGARVQAYLDNQTTSASFGEAPVQSKFITVYISCIGTGELAMSIPELPNVKNMKLPCRLGPIYTQFQVVKLKSYTVSIASSKAQRWSGTITLNDKISDEQVG